VTSFEPEARDPGLAAERTDLAWSRSGLSLVACGAVLLRGLARPPLTASDLAIGLCIVGLGAFVAALGVWRARQVRRSSSRRATASDLMPVSVGVAMVGTAAFVVAAVFPT
jgi:putative membrane protein